jgi:glyoxylase-like metal-dependent hydrolase (beta-lactamase superfamily II)
MVGVSLLLALPACAEIQVPAESPPAESTAPAAEKKSGADGYSEAFPKVPAKGYVLTQLAPDVYFFSTGIYNSIFVVAKDGVILVDAIEGKGDLLKRAIAEITAFPVKFLIYSHAGLDHIGDAYLFKGSAQIIAHRETRRLLERYADARRPLPNISFASTYTLNYGGKRMELIYPGEGGLPGNIIIYLPDAKIAMLVDVATPKSVPARNFSLVDVFSQIDMIKKALELQFDTYVAGHLNRPGKREELQEVLQYYMASKKADEEALRRVSLREVAGKAKTKDVERVFGEYYQAVAEVCYGILKNDWKHRLMGFEVYARSHCDVWTEFHRTQQAPPPAP